MTGTLPPEREAFRVHYEEDRSQWGKSSGRGSDPYHTIEYRCFLEQFIRMNNIKSIVDIGCGDWRFSRFMNFDDVSYIGFDVVPGIIDRNSERFSSTSIKFAIMPDDIAAVPGADLLLMKDVLQHLPNEVILEFAGKVFGKFNFCLLTNSFVKLNTETNIDVSHGGFRCLDLSAPPYRFKGCYVLEFASPLWERIRTFLYCA